MYHAARFMFPRLSAVTAVLFLGLGGGLLPTDALAYYPCNGPGPGEVLIGVDNTNGVQTPLCEYVGEEGGGDQGGGYSDPGPGGYWADRFTSLAWGVTSDGAPTYSWMANAGSEAEANDGALAECVSAGFGNCSLGPGVINGTLVITIGQGGNLYAEWGETVEKAKRKSLRLCRKTSKGCSVDRVLEGPAQWISY